MGRDVHCISKHSLNISSAEVLAQDISQRFKANVIYGYCNFEDIDFDGNYLTDYIDYVTFGEVKHPNPKTTLRINDEFFVFHKIYEKHGENAYKLKYFEDERDREKLGKSINSVSYEIESMENHGYGRIFNDAFHNMFNHFDGRWWTFCTAFTEQGKEYDLLKYVNEYRKKVFDFIRIIGGDAVVYFDDQGDTQYMTEGYFGWDEMLNELETKFKNTTLNVSEFMVNKPFLPKEKYPLAFYDDFKDFKNNSPFG